VAPPAAVERIVDGESPGWGRLNKLVSRLEMEFSLSLFLLEAYQMNRPSRFLCRSLDESRVCATMVGMAKMNSCWSALFGRLNFNKQINSEKPLFYI
jgi:hypothetical protein